KLSGDDRSGDRLREVCEDDLVGSVQTGDQISRGRGRAADARVLVTEDIDGDEEWTQRLRAGRVRAQETTLEGRVLVCVSDFDDPPGEPVQGETPDRDVVRLDRKAGRRSRRRPVDLDRENGVQALSRRVGVRGGA